MNIDQKRWIRFRIYVVAFFLMGGLGFALARAYQLQVLEKDKLVSIAKNNYRWIVNIPPRRGAIYDREGNELALSIEVKSVYAHPYKLRDKKKCARLISTILEKDYKAVLVKLKKPKPFVWIERRIDPRKALKVMDLGLEGIGIVSETRRYYPAKQIAAHVIGFSGIDQQGLEGLELEYDKQLKGPGRKLVQMRDAMARPFFTKGIESPGSGPHHITLTIDKDIQYKAEQELKSAVASANAEGGHCVVVDPGTGEILAMAVFPDFNPNSFTRYEPFHWRNRCITDCYEPGSTIKAFLLAASLQAGAVTPETKFDCEQGKLRIGRHVIHDVKKQGILTVSEIIRRSSNIGAVKIGMKLKYEKFYEYLERLGFGMKTGIDLPGERSGLIRSVDEATTIDQANLFFGQGMSTTSLQMAMAISAIANGGKLMRPFVVKSVVDDSGREVIKNSPKMERRVISEKTAKEVSRILEGVIAEGGTGLRASIKGYRAAGKTGTAQKVDSATRGYSTDKYVSGFMGFVPVVHPKLAIVIMIDEPKGNPYGGVVAAPVFKEVVKWSLNKMGVSPQVRVAANSTAPEPSRVKEKPGRVKMGAIQIMDETIPNFKGLGMRKVLKMGKSLGLKVSLKGSGIAYKQEPAAGFPLDKAATLKVDFKPPS
ncbi:penicillin-binding protein [Thermodesulfobacteriota bacterium]